MPVTITVRRLTQESGSEFAAYLSYAGHSRPFISDYRGDTARTKWCMWWCLCFQIRLLLHTRIYAWTWAVCGIHGKTLVSVLPHTSAQPAPRAADWALGHSDDKCSYWWGSGTQESGLRNARWYIWRASFQSIVKICSYIFAFAFSLESTADRISRIQMPA